MRVKGPAGREIEATKPPYALLKPTDLVLQQFAADSISQIVPERVTPIHRIP